MTAEMNQVFTAPESDKDLEQKGRVNLRKCGTPSCNTFRLNEKGPIECLQVEAKIKTSEGFEYLQTEIDRECQLGFPPANSNNGSTSIGGGDDRLRRRKRFVTIRLHGIL